MDERDVICGELLCKEQLQNEKQKFLTAIQDQEARKKVITILREAGLLL